MKNLVRLPVIALLASACILCVVHAQNPCRTSYQASGIPFGAIAAWNFDGSTPLLDVISSIRGQLVNGAQVVDGALVVNGNGQYFFADSVLFNLRDKTLESWAKVNSLDTFAPGVCGIQTPGGRFFDSIVYNEFGGRRWLGGSDYYVRTVRPSSPVVETEANARFVHIVITYNNYQVRIYREAQLIESYTMPSAPFTFNGPIQFITGIRHVTGGNTFLNGAIDEFRIYNRPLSANEITASWGRKASVRSHKTLDIELEVGSTFNGFSLRSVAGSGTVTINTISDDSSVATVAVSPGSATTGVNRTLSYSAISPGATLVHFFHSDSLRTVLTQQAIIKVFPRATVIMGPTCTANGGVLTGGRCFTFHNAPAITWNEANDACRNQGRHLASIRSVEENNLARLRVNNAAFWIGFHDRHTTGSFVWTDGDTSRFRNWAPNEPSLGRNEDCVMVSPDGTWKDTRCTATADFYVCETFATY